MDDRHGNLYAAPCDAPCHLQPSLALLRTCWTPGGSKQPASQPTSPAGQLVWSLLLSAARSTLPLSRPSHSPADPDRQRVGPGRAYLTAAPDCALIFDHTGSTLPFHSHPGQGWKGCPEKACPSVQCMMAGFSSEDKYRSNPSCVASTDRTRAEHPSTSDGTSDESACPVCGLRLVPRHMGHGCCRHPPYFGNRSARGSVPPASHRPYSSGQCSRAQRGPASHPIPCHHPAPGRQS